MRTVDVVLCAKLGIKGASIPIRLYAVAPGVEEGDYTQAHKNEYTATSESAMNAYIDGDVSARPPSRLCPNPVAAFHLSSAVVVTLCEQCTSTALTLVRLSANSLPFHTSLLPASIRDARALPSSRAQIPVLCSQWRTAMPIMANLLKQNPNDLPLAFIYGYMGLAGTGNGRVNSCFTLSLL